MKRIVAFLFISWLPISHLQAAAHPVLLTEARIEQLAAGGAEWSAIKSYCDSNLNLLIYPGYVGWDWRTAVENYGLCYHVSLAKGDTVSAAKYAKKGVAIMKVLARHHYYGGPTDAQLLGQGDGTTTAFTLPFTPMPGTTVEVLTRPVQVIPFVYSASAVTAMANFYPILKISNTATGGADYARADYTVLYRDCPHNQVFSIQWNTGHQPADGASFYVSVAAGDDTILTSGQYSVSGLTLTLTAAPSNLSSVWVRTISDQYEQTGDFMGGLNSVQPDGPGYPMRSCNVGLAYGYDLFYNDPSFTPELKAEFWPILAAQVDWYRNFGYSNNYPLGNYFTEGYLTGTVYTAYATQDENPNAATLKKLAYDLVHQSLQMAAQASGGYGFEGEYTAGDFAHPLIIYAIWKNLTGEDLIASLQGWIGNIIRATIHATKPDGKTMYNGGDWDPPIAPPHYSLIQQILPLDGVGNHPLAPYARQWLADGNQTFTAGTMKNYKADFPPSYWAVNTPIYARTDWSATAMWASFYVGNNPVGHAHSDQGHFTINRGADDLIGNSGGYGHGATLPSHNSIGFDDGGRISTYPPGQGSWGDPTKLKMNKFESATDTEYGQADFSSSYVKAFGDNADANVVKRALRSMLFIRPDIFILHDSLKTDQADVVKIFNLNFSNPVTQTGSQFKMTRGNSNLFMQSVLPANPSPVFTSIVDEGKIYTWTNYQVKQVGNIEDNFLHVFQATDKSVTSMDATNLLTSADQRAEGVEVNMGSDWWAVLFSTGGDALSGVLHYTTTHAGAIKNCVTDLPPNRYYNVTVVSKGATVLNQTNTPSSPMGTLHFSFTASASADVVLTPTGSSVDITGPAAPTGFKATPGDGQIAVTWDPNSEPNLTGYNLYRATGTDFVKVTPNSTPLPLYIDKSGVIHLGVYRYYVTALDSNGMESPPSIIVSVTYLGPNPRPPTPAGTTISMTADGKSVVLGWWYGYAETDLAGYFIYRSAGSDPYSRLFDKPFATPYWTYTDTTVANGNLYRYYLTAVNTLGEESDASTGVQIVVGTPPPPLPAAPTGVKAISAKLGVNVTWNPPSGMVIKGYNVYRAIEGSFSKLNSDLVSNPPILDQDVTVGTTYRYYVTVVDGNGVESFPSAISSVFYAPPPPDPTRPAAPTGLSLSGQSPPVHLTWASNTESDLAGYNLYRSVGSELFSKLSTSLLTSASYVDTQVSSGNRYRYYVTAVNATGAESEASNVVDLVVGSSPDGPASQGNSEMGHDILINFKEGTISSAFPSGQIAIYSKNGQKVREFEGPGNIDNMKGLAAGIYFYKVGDAQKKLVVVK